jgi:hypothetical protein
LVDWCSQNNKPGVSDAAASCGTLDSPRTVLRAHRFVMTTKAFDVIPGLCCSTNTPRPVRDLA